MQNSQNVNISRVILTVDKMFRIYIDSAVPVRLNTHSAEKLIKSITCQYILFSSENIFNWCIVNDDNSDKHTLNYMYF